MGLDIYTTRAMAEDHLRNIKTEHYINWKKRFPNPNLLAIEKLYFGFTCKVAKVVVLDPDYVKRTGGKWHDERIEELEPAYHDDPKYDQFHKFKKGDVGYIIIHEGVEGKVWDGVLILRE